jgi:hypothetical protein
MAEGVFRLSLKYTGYELPGIVQLKSFGKASVP